MSAGNASAPRPQAVAPGPKSAYPSQSAPTPPAGQPRQPSLTLGNKASALALLTLTLLALTFIPAKHAAAQIAPSFGGATVVDQVYIQNITVVNLTLPAATSGTPPLTYNLAGVGGATLNLGLTFDAAPDARVLQGTPTSQGTANFAYTVVNSIGIPDTITFRITVLNTFTFESTAFVIRQTYTAGTPVSFTLPAATGGTPPLTYQLTPFSGSLPDGLAFDTTTHVLSGTPTTAQAEAGFSYTVTDSNSLSGSGPNLALTILEAQPLTFGDTTIAPQSYPINAAVSVTLPAANDGYGTLTYAINPTPALPTGLAFDGATRVLSGTAPATPQAAMTYTYTATDMDPAGANAVQLSFTIAIIVPPLVADVTCAEDSPAVPSALALNFGDRVNLTGYPAPPSVSLSWGTDPNGVGTFASAGAVSTTWTAPAADPGAFTLEYGSGGRSDDCVVTVTLSDPISFGSATIDSQTYTAAVAITDLTLPAATGGNTPLTYAITETLPDGLTFTAATRVLSGIPTAAQAETTYTYTATDANTSPTTVELSFTITINEPGPLVADVTCADGSPAVPSALALNFGDRVNLTGYPRPPGVSLTWGTDPDGVGTFASAGAVSTTWTVPAADPGAFTLEYGFGGRSGICVVTVTLSDPISFGSATIDSQTYTAAVAITDLTLPAATGGNTPLTYAITETLPDGLTFTAATRVLSGIPTAAQAETTYTYTATDANTSPTTVELSFTITINEPGPLVADVTCADGSPAVPSALALNFGDRVNLTGYPRPPGVSLTWGTDPDGVGTFADVAVSTTWTAPAADPGAFTLEYGSGGRSGICVVTVTLSAPVSFGSATIDSQTYTAAVTTDLTLPAATGGNTPLTYAITEALPDGLTFTAATRVLSGIPTAAQAETTYTYTATDANTSPNTVELSFTITINEPAAVVADVTCAEGGPAMPSALTMHLGDRVRLTGYPRPPGVSLTWGTNPRDVGTFADVTVSTTWTAPAADPGALTLEYGSGGRSGICVVTVTFIDENNDASLSALALSGGAVLAPAFAAGTLAYTTTVANSVANITVTPTTGDEFATVTVGGNAVDSGAASAAIALTAGMTTNIDVVVTASDRAATQTYTLAVTRTAPDITATPISTGTNEVTVTFSAPVNVAASGEANFASSALNKTHWRFFDAAPTTPTTIEPNSDGTAVIITLLMSDGGSAPLDSGLGSLIVLQPGSGRSDIAAATGAARVIGFSLRLMPADISFAGTRNFAGAVTEDGTLTAEGTVTATNVGNGAEVDLLPRTDADGDYGLFSINADGEWDYTLGGNTANDTAVNALPGTGAGQTVTDIFTINSVAGGSQDITITITGANDPPVAAIDSPADRAQVEFGSTVTLTGSATDPDSLSDLTYSWSTVPSNRGSFIGNTGAAGVWVAPTSGTAPVTMRLLVTDTFFPGVTNSAEITLNPVATPVTFSSDTTGGVTEDDAGMNTATGDLTPTTSAGATTVAVQTDQPGTYGTFTVTAPGVWTYTLVNTDPDTDALAAGVEMTDTFRVVATANPDATVDVVITVTGANDAPTASITTPAPALSGTLSFVNGQRVNLVGSGEDVDTGTTLTYAWSASPNPGSFADFEAATTTWNPPSTVTTPTNHTLTLTVTDNDSGTGTATFVLQVMQGPGVGGPGLDDSPQIPRTDIDLNGVITSGGRASGMLTVARIPTDQTTGNPLPVTHSILTQPTYGIASITDEALTRNVGDYWNYLLVNNEESIPFGPGSDTPAPADDTFMVQTTIGPDIVLTSTITVTLTEDAFPDDPPVIRFAGGSRMTVDEGEEMVTLDASGSSDPEGGTLMYLWAQNTADDIPVTLSGANTATATFTAPDERTTLRFDLRVTDDDTTPTLATTAIAARLTVQVGRTSERALQKTLAAFGRAFATGTVGVFEDYLSTPTRSNTSHFTIGGHKFDMATTTPSAAVGTDRDLSALASPSFPNDRKTGSTTPLSFPNDRKTGSDSDHVFHRIGNPVEHDLANTINSANLADTTSNGATTSDDTPATTTTTLMSGQDLLMQSAFHVNLNDDATGTSGWSLWARATTTNFNGKPEDDFDLNGDVTSAYLGADYHTPTGTRLGLAISETSGEVDYDDATDGTKGDLDADLTSILPYIQWQPNDTTNAWAMLGYGKGDAELATDGDDETTEVDIDMQMIALGVSGDLTTYKRSEWSWKASAFAVELESDENAETDLPAVDASAQRLRAAIQGRVPGQVSTTGAQFIPNWELGLRWDDGDAEQGSGADLGLGFNYTNPANGLSVQGKTTFLVAHEAEDYEEWDASLQARLDPGVQGRGITFTLEPGWSKDARSQRMGMDFSNALGKWTKRGLRLELTGERTEKTDNNIGHNIRLTGSLRF